MLCKLLISGSFQVYANLRVGQKGQNEWILHFGQHCVLLARSGFNSLISWHNLSADCRTGTLNSWQTWHYSLVCPFTLFLNYLKREHHRWHFCRAICCKALGDKTTTCIAENYTFIDSLQQRLLLFVQSTVTGNCNNNKLKLCVYIFWQIYHPKTAGINSSPPMTLISS